MTHYLIEFRFFGKAKREAKQLIYDVKKRFRLGYRKEVPHISLAGPFTTRDERRLINDFYRVCSQAKVMKFKVQGFSTFEHSGVVYFDIKPSNELEEFRWNLSKTIQPYCQLRPYDLQREFYFHSTIAMKLPSHKLNGVKNYIQKQKSPDFKHVLVRATLIKNSRILKEYDFLQRKYLDRRAALSRQVNEKTKELLRKFFEGDYDPNKNVPTHSETPTKEEIQEAPQNKYCLSIQEEQGNIIVPKKSIFSSISDYFNPPRIFLISDLHLDHARIIGYCKRPFNNVNRMNTVLVNNWNRIVRRQDIVYFLGDMSFGRGSRSADYWLNQLNGNIMFITGFSYKESGERNQHDIISKTKNVFDQLILDYKGKKFFLVHDPAQVPKDWKEWAICGHHHNNRLQEFPFINGENKRINVSVELINYRPLNIDKLFELDFENIKHQTTIDSQPLKK